MIKVNWHVGYILGFVATVALIFRFATDIGLILFISLLLALLLHPVSVKWQENYQTGLQLFWRCFSLQG